jgi:hypothetical protein
MGAKGTVVMWPKPKWQLWSGDHGKLPFREIVYRGKQSRPASWLSAGYWPIGAALVRESLVERERPVQMARSGSVESKMPAGKLA